MQLNLSHDVSERVRQMARSAGIGHHMVLEVMHHVALARILGRPDVTTLNVVKGRKAPELLGLIGNFVNLLPSRSCVRSELTLSQALTLTREMRHRAAPHSTMPCNALVQRCGLGLAEFPHYNFLLKNMSPGGWFGDLGAADCDRMSESIGTRTSLMVPDDQPEASVGKTSNPYMTTPYVLFIVDTPALEVTCLGAICSPFTPEDVARAFELVINATTTDPDLRLGSLL
jgi:non-ribosomal peptide synthetase component F